MNIINVPLDSVYFLFKRNGGEMHYEVYTYRYNTFRRRFRLIFTYAIFKRTFGAIKKKGRTLQKEYVRRDISPYFNRCCTGNSVIEITQLGFSTIRTE